MSKAKTSMNVIGARSILGGLVSETLTEPTPPSGEVIQQVRLKEIYRPQQPRKFFNPDEIEKLKQAITTNGFQGAILITSLPQTHPERSNGFKYELVYGGSRCQAMQELQEAEIPATVRDDLSKEQIHRIRLDENLVRANLNPLEEVEGLIEVMAYTANVEPSNVEKDLNQLSNTQKRQTSLAETVSARLEIYQGILDYYKKGKLSSFRTQLIRFRSLPDDIEAAVNQGKIDASKALEIATIKETAKRAQLLQWIINENPSVKQIREEKRKLATAEKQKSQSKHGVLRRRLEKSMTQLSKSSILDNPDASTQETIEQIEKLIQKLLTK